MVKYFNCLDGIQLAHTYSISSEGEIVKPSGKVAYVNSVRGRPCVKLWTAEGKRRGFYLHRILFEMFVSSIPAGLTIDHINRDITDNRIENLRLATLRQQCWNVRKKSDTKYLGTKFDPTIKIKPWRARVNENYREISIGYFTTQFQAALAYDAYIIKTRGKFAQTNILKAEDFPQRYQEISL